MLHDIWCVAWKELMMVRRNLRSYMTSYLLVLVIWGVVFPATSLASIWSGQARMPLLLFAYLAVFLGSGLTITAFVGERMQKTLGTLLTTRLSDAAIYLGKVMGIILIAYTVMLLVLVLHLATVFIGGTFIRDDLGLPYSLMQMVFLLVMPILSLIYTSSLGVLISLKSTNIRGQHLLNLFMGVPIIVLSALVLDALSWPTLLLTIFGFGVICAAITLYSIRRFNRQTLILQ
jgi:ABC-type Na+ efflux pump permease subunit